MNGNKFLLGLAFLLLLGAFAGNTQEAGEKVELIPENIPQEAQDFFILNFTFELSFGNTTLDDYAFMGNNGQGHIKPGITLMKSFGPLILTGQVSNAIGFASNESYNQFDINFTPLLFIPVPTGNIIAGVQFSSSLPYHNGRLVGTALQVPAASPFRSSASLGIYPGFLYTHLFNWGAIHGMPLFMVHKPVAEDGWIFEGDFEVGAATAMGIGVSITPNFLFRQMGEKPDNMFQGLAWNVNYSPSSIPITAAVAFNTPLNRSGNYAGMIITPSVHSFFFPGWDLWFSTEFQRVGNKTGHKVGVIPKIGFTVNPIKPPGYDDGGISTAETDKPEEEEEEEEEEEILRWHIGVTAGYVNNWLFTSTAGRPDTEYDNGHGFEFTVPIRYQIRPWFAIQGEVQYIKKNYKWRRTGPFDEVYTNTTNSFIDFPVMVNFSLGWEKFKVFANVGGYGGVWIGSKRKGNLITFTDSPFDPGMVYYHEFKEKAEFDSRRDARFDGGLLAGFGAQYALTPCTLFLEGRYYHGLTDLQQNYGHYMVPRINNSFAVRIGVLFNRNIFQIFNRGG